MQKLLIPEIFERASKLKSKNERMDFLKKNSSGPLKDVIRIAFDDAVVSVMPEGAPPYQKDDAPIGHSSSTLYKQYKQFKFFFKGPAADGVKPLRRETMFIRLLESIHSSEAEMLVLAKDKKMKYTGITKKLCQDAFPGLIAK